MRFMAIILGVLACCQLKASYMRAILLTSPSGPSSTSAGIPRLLLLSFLAFDPRFLSFEAPFLSFEAPFFSFDDPVFSFDSPVFPFDAIFLFFDFVEPPSLEAECSPLDCLFSDPIILPRRCVRRSPRLFEKKVEVRPSSACVSGVSSR